MKEDLLTSLPQAIAIDILRRVPLRSIIICKHVCKSWRDLIKGDEFMMSYTMKPCLIFIDRKMGYVVCSDETHEPLYQFNVPTRHKGSSIIGSANGMLLMWNTYRDILFTFNPITGNYIELDPLPIPTRYEFALGFGVSKLNGQYKILYANRRNSSYFVHNLPGQGKGGWRNISVPPEWIYVINYDNAVFFNGNLYWLAMDMFTCNVSALCCFDLETELFTSFSLPMEFDGIFQKICVLGGHLCVCDQHSLYDGVVIWSMKDYGDMNSWIKEYTFTYRDWMRMSPLKILANGDLVFTKPIDGWLSIYSKSTDTIVERSILQNSRYYSGDSSFVIYTPS